MLYTNKLKSGNTLFFSKTQWAKRSAEEIAKHLSSLMQRKTTISVVLTGGRSAARVYQEWSKASDFSEYKGIHFYFSDERLNSPVNETSNYDLVTQTLFSGGFPENCEIFPICRDGNSDLEATKYSNFLPKEIDILILTLGEDGHIASIFPGNTSIHDTDRLFAPVVQPETGGPRISITPIFLSRVQRVFMLAPGLRRLEVLDQILEQNKPVTESPARLITSATWLLCI